MSIFKCKMCGGDIELSADKTFGTCECCGTSMTFPKINDEQRLAMFNRGNAFRRAGEFDKALALYENIVREDDTDAEAHWCCALCRFGIEYVEDPATFEYVPTCHRASFDSFLDDVDYKAAVNNADGLTKRQYQKDALRIADVQKGILATSQNEEPFDVFICYKETDDATGQRTRDSIDAQEIYYQLTNEGYRVFFSRITLEDKAGAEYEPYIFAALNSAKVMVVIGSKPEYFNAVWVKNEWSRFIAMMRKDRNKLLLPCYRDIDPYDLPEQLSVLQSYDMTKIGFIQDLIRGIKKITASDEPKAVVKETVVVENNTSATSSIAPLLKRVFMFLEDGNWNDADEYCEKVLDINPECAEAYLGKLMAELQVKTKDNIKNVAESFENNNNYIKASRFDPAIAEKLKADNEFILERNETTRKTKTYNSALEKMKSAKTEADFKSAAESFNSIKGFKDADDKAKECNEKAEIARKNSIYDLAISEMNMGDDNYSKKSHFKSAVNSFELIIDWKDSRNKINECNREIEKIRIAEEKAEAERKQREKEAKIAAEKARARNKKIAMVVTPIIAVVVVFLIVLNTVILPASNYKKAMAAVEAGNYNGAYLLFEKCANYKDTQDQINLAKVKQATELFDAKKYDEAYKILENIDETESLSGSIYSYAKKLQEKGYYDGAIVLYSKIEGFSDVPTQLESCYTKKYGDDVWNAIKQFNKASIGDKIIFGLYEQDNNLSNGKEKIEWRVLDREYNKVLIISDKALDCKPYSIKDENTTWETCSLRAWLNETFINDAFNPLENKLISNTSVSAEINPKYKISSGYDTNDKIFLLSVHEAEKYFATDYQRSCIPTDYAIANGAWSNSYNKKDGASTCWWWLRTLGGTDYNAVNVYEDGTILHYGSYVYSDKVCVRPAMWIEIPE